MAVFPNNKCTDFCDWLLNSYWQTLTGTQQALITVVYNASIAQTSVTDQQWKDFNMVTAWKYQHYVTWVGLSTQYCAEAETWFSYLLVQPSTQYKQAINTLILQLIADNNWQYLDRFFIFATELEQHAWVSLKNPSSIWASPVNSPQWAPRLGYKSNGTTSWVDTNFNPSIGVNNMTLNSTSAFCYARLNVDENRYAFGASGGGNVTGLILRASNLANAVINSGTASQRVNNDSRGLLSCVRLNATQQYSYKNGISLGSTNVSSIALPSSSFGVLTYNYTSGIGTPCTNQISMFGCGSSLINQVSLYSAFQTFATSLGFNV